MIESNQMVTLNAPKGSATMKSSEKGIGTSLHKFTFSHVSLLKFKKKKTIFLMTFFRLNLCPF